MNDRAKSQEPTPRERRLQAALRENLKRRKIQARGRQPGSKDEGLSKAKPDRGDQNQSGD
ncbi:MAG TPA: hypothetical protein VHN11_14645 [Xanthobacteraceae bacterium]|jgi:hypothetical protein|nr:hypothetical protein [Xanthobacteraceae bacterium]